MAIEIAKEFEVDQSPEEVWDFLVDPHRVVECLPGAKIVEQVDERTYEGEMGLELGPMGVTFRGRIHFDRMDEEDLEVEMSGSGEDAKGTGGVSMSMQSRLERREDGGTRVAVRQNVDLSGRLASFGRGGIVKSVADMMFGRFTRCVAEKLAGG